MRLLLLTLLTVACTRPEIVPEIKQTPKPVEKPKVSRCLNPPAIVAVIDTGFGYEEKGRKAPLCNTGHKNFTLETKFYDFGQKDLIPIDTHGHGTNIAGVIAGYAGDSNFCLVILKYYSPTARANDNLNNTIKAIKYATKIGAKFINYSGGGTDRSVEEAKAVKAFIDGGGTFVAAAGNERSDLDSTGYYPALEDPRVVVVGNAEYANADDLGNKDFTKKENKRFAPVQIDGSQWLGVPVSSSNYGNVIKRWELGVNVEGYGLKMTGTSQAAAIATGKLVKEKSECLSK